MLENIETTEVVTGELSVINYELIGFDESAVPKNRIVELRETFVPMLQGLDTHKENKYIILNEFADFRDTENLVPPELEKKAKRHRLDIAKFRVATEKARKKMNEDINLTKAGNDALAKYIKSLIESEEKDIGAIEDHNESIRLKQAQALQVERSATALEYGFDEVMDFSAMAQIIFDNFIEGLKSKKAAEEETNRKQDLRASRQTECLNISEYIANYDAIDLAELSSDSYVAMVDTAKNKKLEIQEQARLEREEAEKEQQRIRDENAKLLKEKEESEARAEAEKEARETRELAEKLRQDKANQLAKEAREKAEKEVHDAKEAEELKTREAEEAKQAEEKAKQELKEVQDAEAKRIKLIKALAESSKEITAESIQKVIEAGQTIFVQVVTIENIEGKSGIFIKPSEK